MLSFVRKLISNDLNKLITHCPLEPICDGAYRGRVGRYLLSATETSFSLEPINEKSYRLFPISTGKATMDHPERLYVKDSRFNKKMSLYAADRSWAHILTNDFRLELLSISAKISPLILSVSRSPNVSLVKRTISLADALLRADPARACFAQLKSEREQEILAALDLLKHAPLENEAITKALVSLFRRHDISKAVLQKAIPSIQNLPGATYILAAICRCDPHPEVTATVTVSLSKRNDPSVLDTFIILLHHPKMEVCLAAVDFVKRHGDINHIEDLAKLRDKNNGSVSQAAGKAIESIRHNRASNLGGGLSIAQNKCKEGALSMDDPLAIGLGSLDP